jgi:hypothetical protein
MNKSILLNDLFTLALTKGAFSTVQFVVTQQCITPIACKSKINKLKKCDRKIIYSYELYI